MTSIWRPTRLIWLILAMVLATGTQQALPASVTSVAAGYVHSLALKSDGTVWGWGSNQHGQLGNGKSSGSPGYYGCEFIPLQVPGLAGVVAVAGGFEFSIALKADGTVWTWGLNNCGQLGDGTCTDRTSPTQVSGLSGVVAMATGWSHSLAVRSDGTVWAWGYNPDGRLGNGKYSYGAAYQGFESQPVQVLGLTGVVAVGAGADHSFALKADGTVWAWGRNDIGQLGDGSGIYPIMFQPLPVPVLGLTDVARVTGGQWHSVALRQDGTVWTWGRNHDGILGTGATTDQRTPVPVPGLTGAIAVAAGNSHSLAVKADGTVWVWGQNNYGQLGNGGDVDAESPTPLQVPGLIGVVTAASQYSHILVLTGNGTIWAWGYNSAGQVGINPSTRWQSTPVPVVFPQEPLRWANQAGGEYALEDNWISPSGEHRLPTATDDLVFDLPSMYSVRFSSAAYAKSVSASAGDITFELNGSGLCVTTGITVRSKLTVEPGLLKVDTGQVVVGDGGHLRLDEPVRPAAAGPPCVTALHGIVVQDGGQLSGSGTLLVGQDVQGVVNGGTVRPDAASSLRIAGDYLQDRYATLAVTLDASRPPETAAGLQITGEAVLDGTLKVDLAGATAPAVGTRFPIIACGSLQGRFVNSDAVSIPGHPELVLVIDYASTAATAVVRQACTLSGRVVNHRTGKPVGGATVRSGALQCQTDLLGQFSLWNVGPGGVTVTTTCPDYYDNARAVDIVAGGNTSITIALIPVAVDPAVVEVRGAYCGPDAHAYYLQGISLTETFTATVDWKNQQPGTIRWITPLATYQSDGADGKAQITLDMGKDFGAGGTLRVVAISGDDPPVQSAPYLVNMKVVPVPPGLSPLTLRPMPRGSVLSYAGTIQIGFTTGDIDQNTMPRNIPGFKDAPLAMKAYAGFEVEVTGDGKAEAKVKTNNMLVVKGKRVPAAKSLIKSTLAGTEFALDIGGKVTWSYNGTKWLTGGGITVGGDLSATTPARPFVIPAGWFVIPCYTRGSLAFQGACDLGIQDWDPHGNPLFTGTYTAGPSLEFMVGPGAADFLAFEGYLRGGLNYQGQFLPAWALQSLTIGLYGGVRAVALVWSYDQPLLKYEWSLYQDVAVAGSSMPLLAVAPPSQFRLMPRDYLARRTSTASGSPNSATPMPLAADGAINGTGEMTIEGDVFPYSTPQLAAAGNDLLLAWVRDDPLRSSINRTQAVLARSDGSAWSTPTPMADDGTADFCPQLAVLPMGDAWAAWENVKRPLPNTATLEEMAADLEITVARYDAATGTWDPAAALTDNACLDRTPRICSAGNGKTLVTWIHNTGNDLLGSTSSPNDICLAIHDGTAWSVPATIASGLPAVIKTALAYDGTHAVLVFVGDTDANSSTTEDRELFAVTCDGTTWSPVIRLTNDSIEDASPLVQYEPSGRLLLLWYHSGQILQAHGLSLADRSVAVDLNSPASGSIDLHLARSRAGRLALVWEDASGELADVWMAMYDPTLQTWGKPQQVTHDDGRERAVSPAFDVQDNLVVVYDKDHMTYESRTGQIGGDVISVDVPVPGRTDLCQRRHVLEGGLAVEPGDIQLDPANPPAGSTTTIRAAVHNTGDLPAGDVAVAFYDGDPSAGGMCIGQATVAGPIVGGDSGQASIPWTVPSTLQPHSLFVVLDPALAQPDRDRTNNAASICVLKPDLAVSRIDVQQAGPDRILTLRLANIGPSPAANVKVVLHRDAADGPQLQTFSLPAIASGSFQDVVFSWANPFAGSLDPVSLMAVVDPDNTVDEFDETDNETAVQLVYVPPQPQLPGDINADDYVNVGDLQQLVANWAGPASDPACDARADLNADEYVNVGDLQVLVANWGRSGS